MKGKFKKAVASTLAALTMLSTVLSPVSVYAAEDRYPDISEVASELSGDEIVKAQDITVDEDSDFNVKESTKGLTYNKDKVRVVFHEAKTDSGRAFSISDPGTYRAVYHVEPVSGARSYSVTRKIIVKEVTLAKNASAEASENKEEAQEEQEDAEDAEDAESEEPQAEEREEEPAPLVNQSEEAVSETEANDPAEEEKTSEETPDPEEENGSEAAMEEAGEVTEEVEEEIIEEVTEEELLAEWLRSYYALPAADGEVNVHKSGYTFSLPINNSSGVTTTSGWEVTHDSTKYWAVCARASTWGPTTNTGLNNLMIRYNVATEDMINELAKWFASGINNGTNGNVKITTGLGGNIGIAEAAYVSMMLQEPLWIDEFGTFEKSFPAAHLLISDLLFGDDNHSNKGAKYTLIYSTMKNRVIDWMNSERGQAILSRTTPYIAFRSGRNWSDRQPLFWVEGIPGRLIFTKQGLDENGNVVDGADVSGAEYTVYKDAECTKVATSVFGEPAVMTIGEGNVSNTLYLKMATTYYVKETKAAPGFGLNPEIEEVTIPYRENMQKLYLATRTVQDSPPKDYPAGNFELTKTDALTGKSEARGAATLAGTVYELVNNNPDQSDMISKDGSTTYAFGDVVATIKTNAKGKAAIADIPVGTYILREKTAPKGYELNTETADFVIEEGKKTSLQNIPALQEKPITAPFKFKKTDSNGTGMADVEFTVTCKDTGESWTIKTSADGTYDSLNETDPLLQKLPYGTYILKEEDCDANAGYILADDIEFKVEEDGKALDLGNVVNTREHTPSITTTLAGEDGRKVFEPGVLTLTDTIKYADFDDYVGKEVTFEGKLFDKSGTELMTKTEKFTVAAPSGSYKMTFQLDASSIEGAYVVAAETALDAEGNVIVSHKNLNDKNQTIYIPTIATSAKGSVGDESIPAKGKVTVTDTVTYKFLQANVNYKVEGTLYDAATGKEFLVDGKPVTASTSFKPTKNDGTIDVVFEFTAPEGLEGMSLVVAETLYDAKGNVAAEHKDMADKAQTVYAPKIRTNAVDASTGTHSGIATAQNTVVKDKVTYTNLIPGKSYTIKGTLMDKATGNAISGATAQKTFTPSAANGSVELTFKVASSLVAGKTVVAFETLYHENIEFAVHADINDENQTVNFCNISTIAKDQTSGTHYGMVSGDTVTIIDTVSYKGLEVGEEYNLTGVLMNKEDNTELAGGKYTSSVTFTPEAPDGSVDMMFEVDAEDVSSVKVVVFETLKKYTIEVASHKDINDAAQTVTYPGVTTEAKDKATGSSLVSYGTDVIVEDTVYYDGLESGKEYVLTGVLMDKSTGEELKKADGSAITVSQTFTPAKSSGSYVLSFTVDSTLLAGTTAVAFETITRDGKQVAVHADIEDDNQTVYFPEVGTKASDNMTKDEVGTSKKGAVITDVVSYSNVVAGESYTITGKLADKATGELLKGADGKEITASTTFTADSTEGKATVTFTIDADILKGHTVVAFESLLYNDVEVAVHADINDKEQSVTYPGINTNASDVETKDHVGLDALLRKLMGKEPVSTVIDRVEYEGLVIGKEYTVSGVLMDKATGKEFLDDSGEKITAEKTFTADKESGSIELTFTVASSLLKGKTLVVFEDLIHEEVVVAAHADIKDHDQTVYYPTVSTTAKDKETDSQTGPVAEETTIVDSITMTNLVPGQEYTVKGRLMDKDKNEVLQKDGKDITNEVTFTAESETQTIEMEFVVDSTKLSGKDVVVFESLYHNDIKVAVDEDINNENQTVSFPGVTTDAKDEKTEDHVGQIGGLVKVVDVVTYKNLKAGKEYTVKGTLMVKPVEGEEGELPLLDKEGKPVTAEKTFTAEDKNGTVELIFNVDSTLLAGRSVVAFEDLYSNNVKVAAHADIEDEDQTVYYPEIGTVAKDKETGDQTGKVGTLSTVVDTVNYKNLVPGKEYTVKGTLVNKADGSELKNAAGEAVTAEKTFTPEAAEGSVELEFTFDSTLIQNGAAVAYEKLYHNDIEIAVHADIEDEDQTVYYPEVTTDAKDEATGDHTGTVAEETTIIDVVTAKNLIVGKEYTVKGTLMVKPVEGEEGELPLLDNEDKPVTAEKTFTAEAAEAEIELSFTFDSSLLGGKTVVAFEDLTHNGVTVAAHADIEDEAQSVHYPEVATTAEDVETGDHSGKAFEDARVKDTVMFRNLIEGQEYTVKGVLVNKKDGSEMKNAEGEAITAETTFTADASEGEVTLEFAIDASALQGEAVVAFEKLYHNDIEVAAHADIDDHEQTVYYPGVTTDAKDGDAKGHTGTIAEKATVVDAVTCTNLIEGKTYTVKGVLMVKPDADKEEALPLLDKDGNPVTAEKTFTVTGGKAIVAGEEAAPAPITEGEDPVPVDGDEVDGGGAGYAEGDVIPSLVVELTFEVDSTQLEGKSVVAFEDLYHNNIKIAAHNDIEDEDQTVHYPKIGTTATVNGKKTAAARGTLVVKDVVSYKNLIPGKEYILKGVLMDKATGKALKVGGKEVTAQATFTPKTADGETVVEFKFNATGLGKKTLVAFEELYDGDVKVTAHADIKDAAQTITTTPPPSPKTGDDNNMILWLAIAGGAVLIAAGLFVASRKRKA